MPQNPVKEAVREEPPELMSYEISPYKSGSDRCAAAGLNACACLSPDASALSSENEEERPRKPVPSWARRYGCYALTQGFGSIR